MSPLTDHMTRGHACILRARDRILGATFGWAHRIFCVFTGRSVQ